MADFRIPGPLTPLSRHDSLEDGTLCRSWSPRPGPVDGRKGLVPNHVVPTIKPIDDALEISDWIPDPDGGPSHVTVFFRVNFRLPHPAGQHGHFIQHVQRRILDGEGDGKGKEKEHIEFFEAWSVTKGHMTPNMKKELAYAKRKAPDPKKVVLPPGHDEFGGDLYRGTKGTLIQDGLVMFYEGDLPKHFRRNNLALKKHPNDHDPAGNLPASKQKPSFWVHNEGARHLVQIDWNLTGKDEDKWFVKVKGRIGLHGKAMNDEKNWKSIVTKLLDML